MNSNKIARQYCRQVRKWLPCSQKQKQQICNQIKADVLDFLEEFPDADISSIEKRFGSAQGVAAAYVDNMDTAELLESLRIRKRIVCVVGATLLCILLTWAGVVTWAIHYEKITAHGFVVETVTEIN